MFILDKATSHINSIILAYLNNNGIDYIFILGELTSKLQPLDISVNKRFKNDYKKNILNMLYLIKKYFFENIQKKLYLIGFIKFGFQMK